MLEAGILFVDHKKLSLAADDLAIDTALLDCCSYFHINCVCVTAAMLQSIFMLFVPEYDPSPR